ncbi:acyl-CoA hydrolase [Roseovarius sp. MBR-154]|jgi:acyl-CoA hydrolase
MRAGPTLVEPALTTQDADDLAARIIADTGGDIRLALPLGLGKPVTLLNALTRAACDDPEVKLSIFTALTLERPAPRSDMEKRFLAPAMDRLFGAYPEILYARMLRDGDLPANIEIREFFLLAGRWLGVEQMQQNYISANYTHALDVLVAQKPNLLIQLLARDGARYSLSCNTDITADLLARREAGQMDFRMAGEINDQLPFMPGPAAEIDAETLEYCLDPPRQFELFSAVRQPVSTRYHAIGVHVAGLIKDGGTLQLGIGKTGDAIAHALIQRQTGQFSRIMQDLAPGGAAETTGFETGLYAVAEMLVGGLLALFEEGLLKRQVEGAAIHAAFFVEDREFYAKLRAMTPERRAQIQMRPVSFTNALYGDEAAKRAARTDARFVNSAMKASLLGAVASDVKDDGQVVSGVGGQFNFVEQAFALEGARSILTLPSTRESGGKTVSNIVWDLPFATVPHHMRDIVVTEYGVADLRGQPDHEVIARMLAITDARFQDSLLKTAQQAGKIGKDFRLGARRNTPERLEKWRKAHQASLPDFPFGTDFDTLERLLLPALARLARARHSPTSLAGLVAASLLRAAPEHEPDAMARMGFDAKPRLGEPLTERALRGALRREQAGCDSA